MRQPTFLYALAIAVSGILAAGRASAFAAAAASALLAAWGVPVFFRRKARKISVLLDPDQPSTSMFADGIRAALQSAADGPAELRVQPPPEGHYLHYSLDLGQKRDIRLTCSGKRPATLGFPGRWIADHPLPFVFPNGRPTTLLLVPAGDGRVRVAEARPVAPSPWFWLGLAMASILFFLLDWPIPLAAALAFAGGVWIALYQKEYP